jgi:hypothetical protein
LTRRPEQNKIPRIQPEVSVMRRIAKIVLSLAVLLLVLVAGALAVLFLRFPAVGPAPELQVAGTPEQVERGRYLAHHVTVCVDCHSTRDWSRFSAPPIADAVGHGGEGLSRQQGFPGEIHPPNITPAALGSWTDGEVMRAMVSGLRRDGEPMFAFMPYQGYAALSQEDAESLIAYLRTLPAAATEPRPRELDFPLNLIVRTMPKQATLRERTPRPGDADYGEYLTLIAGCRFCHSPEGEPDGAAFAGGHEFPLASGMVVSPNLTPHELTGIGGWTREAFIARFRAFATEAPPIGPQDPNTVMPWTMYAGMTDEDLGAIYDYLRTVPAVDKAVEKWPAATAGAP